MAARISPKRGSVRSCSLEREKSCSRSQVFRRVAVQTIVKIRPTSPMRLYRTA